MILVVGSDYADVATGTELSFNAKIAANLASPVVLVVHGRDRSPSRSALPPRARSPNSGPIMLRPWR